MNENHQALVDHCFEYARDMLLLNREFHPFGAFIGPSGRVHPLGIELDPKKIPNNGEIVNRLITLAKEEGIKEYALCFEVGIQLESSDNPQDAICVEIAELGLPKFYQPFSKSEDNVVFDELFAVK